MTDAMKAAIEETNRREGFRRLITSSTASRRRRSKKAVHDIAEEGRKLELRRPKYDHTKIPKDEKKRLMEELEAQMDLAARNMEFERAADLRDEIELLPQRSEMKCAFRGIVEIERRSISSLDKEKLWVRNVPAP